MAASQLRLVLEGQRLPRGSVYQPPSKLGAGAPPQVLVAHSRSSCRYCHCIAPAYTLWLWLKSVSAGMSFPDEVPHKAWESLDDS